MIKNLLKEFISLRKGSKNIEVCTNKEIYLPSQKQWKQCLDFIRSNHITEDQIEEVIIALGGKEQVKKEIEKEYRYAEDIRKKHPNITSSELQICCYIVEGKLSKEIATLMGVCTSTITAHRCHLRSKLGVRKGRSLKVYLDSISRLKRKGIS